MEPEHLPSSDVMGDPFDRVDIIQRDALDRMAATLDVPRPSHVPPLWHWVSFLDVNPSSSLGVDGHPRAGGLIPAPPHPRRMFVGGRIRLLAPFPVGTPIRRTASVGEMVHKEGRRGPLVFVTVRLAYSVGDRTLALEEQDLAYRPIPSTQGDPTRARERRPDAGHGQMPEPDLRGEVTFTEPLLFRFSALTFNTHRIHYDLSYARDVERYPGLVVQGSLLTIRLLELLRQAHGEEEVTGLTYRVHEPCFCGATVMLSGRRNADGFHLAATRDRVTLMTADVRLRPDG